MDSTRVMIASVVAWAAVASPVLAQGPCDLVLKQAAQVVGAPAGKSERFKPTATTEVCTVRSADNTASVRLTIMADKQPGQTVMVQRMIAQKSADPDQTFSVEAGLGTDAFSLRAKDTLACFMAGAGRVITAGLDKVRGVTGADVDRARQFAKQVLATK
jgi:hypothetical protein